MSSPMALCTKLGCNLPNSFGEKVEKVKNLPVPSFADQILKHARIPKKILKVTSQLYIPINSSWRRA